MIENHVVSRLRPLFTMAWRNSPFVSESETRGRGARRQIAAVAFPFEAAISQLERVRHERYMASVAARVRAEARRKIDVADLDDAVFGLDAHVGAVPDGAPLAASTMA